MTTIQKAAIVTTLVLASVAIYEARQAFALRTEVQALRVQLASIGEKSAPTQGSSSVAAEPDIPPAATVAAPALSPTAQEWASRFLALNTNGWEEARAVGEALTAIPPDEGLAILRTNWAGVTNITARQQLLQAFCSAHHKWFPAVLGLGLRDTAPEVQNRALDYLRDVSLHDFSDNYSAGLDWLDSRRAQPLSTVLSDALSQTVQVLSSSDADQVRRQLKLLDRNDRFLKDFPEVVASSGLDQTLAQLAGSSDQPTAELALRAARHIPLSDDWRREVALPRLTPENSMEIRSDAALLLGDPGRDWAVPPLLIALSNCVYSSGAPMIFMVPSAISEIGSPTSIPWMIGLIEADNSYNSIYGIGYYGLSKMTGVPYDETHDGAWWRNWWINNKQRFPADAQAIEIPQFARIPH